jgi:ATP-binding cassette subfamily F protein uup
MESRSSEEKAATIVKPKGVSPANREAVKDQPPGKRKLTFREQKELAALEAEIEAGERRQAEIEAELAKNSSDAQLVHQLYQERELLIVRVAGALDRWAELA